jgi:hypothetical protein
MHMSAQFDWVVPHVTATTLASLTAGQDLLCCAVVCVGQHACPWVPGLCYAPSRHRGSEVSGAAAPGSWQQQRQWPHGCGYRQGWPHHCQAQHKQHHRNVSTVFAMGLPP